MTERWISSSASRHQTQEEVAVLREVESMLNAEGETHTIKTRCSLCAAENEYLPEALRLLTLETTSYMLQRSFEFFCMACHELDQQELGEGIWLRLLDAGVPVLVTCQVDEAGEIWVRLEDPPLLAEDVEGWASDIQALEKLPEELAEAVDDNGRSQ